MKILSCNIGDISAESQHWIEGYALWTKTTELEVLQHVINIGIKIIIKELEDAIDRESEELKNMRIH